MLAHMPGSATARWACLDRSTSGVRCGLSPAGPDWDSANSDTRMCDRANSLAGRLDQAWNRPPDGHRNRCCQLPVRFQLSRCYFPPGLPVTSRSRETQRREWMDFPPSNSAVFPILLWTGKRGETSKLPRFTKYDREPNGMKLGGSHDVHRAVWGLVSSRISCISSRHASPV
jgi:hypothetical protein